MDRTSSKLQQLKKHKKAASNFHHISNHFQIDDIHMKDSKMIKQKTHRKSKSYSKQYQKYQRNIHNPYRFNQIQQLNPMAKFTDEYHSQLLKSVYLNKKEKSSQGNYDYVKAKSQNKRNKKIKFIEDKKTKSAENKTDDKSAKKQKNNVKNVSKKFKQIKEKKGNKQKKSKSKEINNEKNSKDSKQSSRNSKKKPNGSNIQQKVQKRQLVQTLKNQKKGIEINFKNVGLKHDIQSSGFPYTPQKLIYLYKDSFTQIQINQMREYKYIYFLGSNFNLLNNNSSNIIKSARQKVFQQQFLQQDQLIDASKNYHQTDQGNINQHHNLNQNPSTTNDQFYKHKIGDHIAYRYQILSTINRGSFGQVLKVLDHKTNELLALKIVKKGKDLLQQTFIEISILMHIKQNDKVNTSGIVRIKDFLFFRNHMCILFELLDGNIYELLTANKFRGFSDEIIKVFAIQILNSLNFLRKQKIIHCDLKPQNLVMNKWGKTAIKLIDFGTSCFQGKQMYSYLQSRYYRAPQVLMQMPYSFPIDMWSFGCIIAELKLGEPLFSGRSSIQQLIYVLSCIGLPVKSQGLFSLAFLENQMLKEIVENNYLNEQREEGLSFGQKNNNYKEKYKMSLKKHCMMRLEDRLLKNGNLNPNFLKFLEAILVWQPEKRLTPEQALRHPWITNGISSQIYSLCYSFNTSSSVSKSKKNSKDSKTNKKSRSNSQKINKPKQSKRLKQQLFQRQKLEDENKIKFLNQKVSQQSINQLRSNNVHSLNLGDLQSNSNCLDHIPVIQRVKLSENNKYQLRKFR